MKEVKKNIINHIIYFLQDLDEEKNISALSMYWTFLLVVWLAFFLMIYAFNDAFIEWCKTLVA